MKLFSVLYVVTSIFISFSSSHDYNDLFNEELIVKPLPTGEVYAQFRFLVEKIVDPSGRDDFKHFRLFPRSLGEIISKNSVQELHLSLTQGLWRHEKWGYSYRDSPPGAELWAWFQDGTNNVDASWRNLVNSLSGQFCASLNFIDETNTVQPQFSYRPTGAVPLGRGTNSSLVRYATLPREIVCTENLTPFKKLLPCDTRAGLSTLLNAINLFNAHFISLAIDSRTVCKGVDCSERTIEFVQSVAVVLNPTVRQGSQDWSFVRLFASGLMNTCPVATKSVLYVDVTSNKTASPFTLNPLPTKDLVTMGNSEFAVYNLIESCDLHRPFNVMGKYKMRHVYWIVPPPPIHASRQITGYGQERGGIQCTIYNNHPTEALKILYMDAIPWYLRVYLHTLTLKSNGKIVKPDHVLYLPAKDRGRPHHLEMVLSMPPKSQTEISVEFEYVFLRWTEYPPDANHGFYVGPATISTMLPHTQNDTAFPHDNIEWHESPHFLRIHTQVLLVSLPTPDFSMPYNVICLTCTVVALAFGPIHNITTRRLQLVLGEEESLLIKAKSLYKKLKLWYEQRRLKKEEKAEREEGKKIQ